MVEYGFGFDPGINECGWAIVSTEGSIICGLIKNPSKATKGWQKLEDMLNVLQLSFDQILAIHPPLSAWTCEGQYTTRVGSQDHNVRLGWLSAYVYALGEGLGNRRIAVPATWTRNVPKELRHEKLLSKIGPPETWKWVGKIANKSQMHNVIDAVGLAFWGLEQNV